MSEDSQETSRVPVSDERPIFVVGNQRSGTTMLRYMLSAHSRIFIPPESNFIPRFIQQRLPVPMERSQAVEVLSSILKYRPFFKDWQGAKPDPESFVDQLPELTLPTLINGLYSTYAGQFGSPRWGDKTPMYITHMDALAELFPSAQFIHILRDGRDVALSMLKAYQKPRFFYLDIYYAAATWQRRLNKAFASGARLGGERYLEVHYEQLVASPESILSQICEYLGESFEPPMVNSHEEAAHHHHSSGIHTQTRQPPTTARVDRWRTEMSPADQWVFQRVAGNLLEQLGYPTVDLGRLSVLKGVRYLGLKIKYLSIETTRRVVQKAGIFHPTAILARKKS